MNNDVTITLSHTGLSLLLSSVKSSTYYGKDARTVVEVLDILETAATKDSENGRQSTT